jgi:hypothetical protein
MVVCRLLWLYSFRCPAGIHGNPVQFRNGSAAVTSGLFPSLGSSPDGQSALQPEVPFRARSTAGRHPHGGGLSLLSQPRPTTPFRSAQPPHQKIHNTRRTLWSETSFYAVRPAGPFRHSFAVPLPKSGLRGCRRRSDNNGPEGPAAKTVFEPDALFRSVTRQSV